MTNVTIPPHNGNRDLILAGFMLTIACLAFFLLHFSFGIGSYLWYRCLFVFTIIPFGILILHARPRRFMFTWASLLITAVFII